MPRCASCGQETGIELARVETRDGGRLVFWASWWWWGAIWFAAGYALRCGSG